MKHSILLILSVLFPTIFFSQENKNKLFYGIKVGATQSTLSPDLTDINGNKNDFRNKTGFTFGARLQVETKKNFVLLTEFNFVKKGAKIFIDYGNRYVNNSSSLTTYAELTINFLKQFSSKQGKFMFGGGPSLALNTTEYNPELNKSDFGVNILAAYQLPIGFSFELNYNKGLKKHKGNNYSLSTQKLSTSVFGFSIGYLF
jgi:hypothetical protein